MQAETAARLLDELRRELARPSHREPFEVDAALYRSPERHARELALFGKGSDTTSTTNSAQSKLVVKVVSDPFPRPVLASSALAPGSCVPVGEGLLLVRDAAGTARAFKNACRHRGTRLVDAPCAAKAITCPYHAWTYDLDGSLRHVPHEWAFSSGSSAAPRTTARRPLDLATRALEQVPLEERHGLLWLGRNVAEYLGALDADLATLDLASHRVWRTARARRNLNWKLLVEAFLDGYHIRTLHRDSVYRFFLDAASVAERAGDHIRAMTARRALRDGAAADIRWLATASYSLFPATTVIVHPDFVSIVTVTPASPTTCDYDHMMLVPESRAGDAEHWDKSWSLIEETVFSGEDLWVCEQVQRSISAGATDKLLFGALEHAVRWFHEAIDTYI